MTIADAVWVATAQLHRDDASAQDFSVREIMEKAINGKLVTFTPGLQVHVSKHCVANKSPNSERHRILFATGRGRRRLFRPGDPFHADRTKGKIHPVTGNLPLEYRELIDWYDSAYSLHKNLLPIAPEPHSDARISESVKPKASGNTNAPSPAAVFVSSSGAFVIPEDLRRALGIHEGTRLDIRKDNDRLVLQPITTELIDRVAGSYRGRNSMVEARERDHRIER